MKKNDYDEGPYIFPSIDLSTPIIQENHWEKTWKEMGEKKIRKKKVKWYLWLFILMPIIIVFIIIIK